MSIEGAVTAVEYRLLGTFEVLVDGTPVVLGGVKQRAVLAMLALDTNRMVTTSRLMEGLWADEPPTRALSTVQVYVSALRKALPRRNEASPIGTRANGYVLEAGDDAVDVKQFEIALDAAREAQRWHDDRLALRHLDDALELWRGDPLADFVDLPFAVAPTAAFGQQYRGAVGQRIDVLLRLGEHRSVLPELEEALAESPLDESLWRSHALALYRCGRQADALAAVRRCRNLLRDELGVDPSPETQALELAVLAHDPSLAAAVAPEPRDAKSTVPAGTTTALHLRFGEDRRELVGTTLIGRSGSCAIVIDDEHVSRQHAEIRRTPTGWVIVDLSMNGTLVNREKVSRHPLQHGDVITIGPRSLHVETD